MLLRATGWRAADVLNLRLTTCLHKENGRWFVQGDITKTGVRDHRVPITDEIAFIVQAQIKVIRENFPENYNPLDLLFPAVSFSRRGLAIEASKVRRALKDFVVKYDIRDEQGNLHHFACHAFRHTKAVEFVNNGMPLVLIQKWLAHISPDMVLVYAKIMDETMVLKWEEITKKGVLRIGDQGNPTIMSPDDLATDNKIEWEYIRHNLDAVRVSTGYCLLSKKLRCEFQANPCHSCQSFATTPSFLPEFRQQREDILIQIDLGNAAGRSHWVEKNQRLLEPINKIIDVLEQDRLHSPLGKLGREYSNEERQKLSDL